MDGEPRTRDASAVLLSMIPAGWDGESGITPSAAIPVAPGKPHVLLSEAPLNLKNTRYRSCVTSPAAQSHMLLFWSCCPCVPLVIHCGYRDLGHDVTYTMLIYEGYTCSMLSYLWTQLAETWKILLKIVRKKMLQLHYHSWEGNDTWCQGEVPPHYHRCQSGAIASNSAPWRRELRPWCQGLRSRSFF